MRLGQLARKLQVRPNQIVEFLATQNIDIDNGTNTRILPEHFALAVRQFSPDTLIEDSPDEGVEANVESIQESDEVTFSNPSAESSTEDVTNVMPIEKGDVIKAPKIELSGLKVLGKIELPEKLKKESIQEPENPERPKEPRNERLSREGKRTSGKNPIALKREQEAREARKKREEDNKLRKERRTQNYLKKVKAPQPTKAVRLFKEDTQEMSAIELQEPPKSLWGKIVRWLTS
jgi:hypothetical protein